METDKVETNKKIRKELFSKYIKTYYESSNLEEELEIRFGTKGVKKISRINFDNVIKYLKSRGFNLESEISSLKIQTFGIDKNTGKKRLSNMRVEIQGIKNIQTYCKTNTIKNPMNDELIDGVTFLSKKSLKDNEGNFYKPIDYNDMNFRVSYQLEKQEPSTTGYVNQVINNWDNLEKLFRYMVRYTFKLNDLFQVDMSIVKTSSRNEKGFFIPTYKIDDSNVFNNNEIYEIEIEARKYKYSEYGIKQIIYLQSDEIKQAEELLKKHIKYILSGLQETNYPISYDEIKNVSKEYFELVFGNSEEDGSTKYNGFLKPRDFIGPSSISLEMKHIQKDVELVNTPNINNYYCITDKADGLRKMLYIAKSGKIYLINTMMDIQFTGIINKNKEFNNTLIDGEHILYDKNNKFINKYAAFDIYYINGKDIRSLGFIYVDEEVKEPELYRLNNLHYVISSLKKNSKNIASTDIHQLNIVKKKFYLPNRTTIFEECKKLMQEIDNVYEYETDGIIFTPTNYGVGCNSLTEKPVNFKKTWIYSLKWKPPEYNTIDFLVTTKKDDTGLDIVNNLFESGESLVGESIKDYKTLTLRVGYNPKTHGYVNPCNMIIEGDIPKYSEDSKDNYKPMPFYPSQPTDINASVCNMILKDGDMFTEDGLEQIEDNMIVEFKYIKDEKPGWSWKPIRVRYDKTAEFRSGIKNYGNAYHVAQSVWNSIHNPITKEMIISGKNIPKLSTDDDVYYNKYGVSLTKPLRDFHNLYVKNTLITRVARKGDTLYDLAVGKGGDISKWINANLSFVFGVDYSKDNIENRIDGACSRYLNYRRENKTMFDGLFIQGNSSLNIKDGTALYSDKSRQIVDAVFGIGPNDASILGKGVAKHYGVGRDGFNIVSCQFALHYFFENKKTLHNFLKNVSDGCKKDGYFIGTCYDGKKLFKELKTKKLGGSILATKDDKLLYKISKSYEKDEFPDDENSLGYTINVYQETINKEFPEYLVNFDYLNRVIQSYGFEVLDRTEAKKIGLPNGSGSFSELYRKMKYSVSKETEKGINNTEMSIGTALELEKEPKQKKLSFLNRYFVYKKMNDVNTNDVYKMFVEEPIIEEKEIGDKEIGEKEEEKEKETVEKETVEKETVEKETVEKETSTPKPQIKKPIKILKRKLLKKKIVIKK